MQPKFQCHSGSFDSKNGLAYVATDKGISIIKIPYANETTHKGKWEKKNIKGTELTKKTLGIVGFGNVGARLSYLVKGFGVSILVNSKSLEIISPLT